MKLKEKTILVVLLLLGAAVLISSVTFYALYERMREETIARSMDSFVTQKTTEIENYFDDLNTLAYSIGYSSWMQTLLQQSGMDQRTLREVEDNIRYFMGSVSDMNGTIRISVIMNNNIRLTAPEGNYLDYSINLEEQEWYPLFMEQGVYAESGMGRGIFTRGDQWYLNIYYPINNRYSLEQMGILVFTIERENMQEFMKSNIAGGYLALQDENGNEIQNNFPQELKDGKVSHTNRFFNTQETIQIQNMELTMNVVLDEDRFEVDNTNIWFGFCIVLFGMMGVFVIIGTVFSRYITMPIIKCKEALLRIRNNEVGILLENPYKDEIGELIDGFNEMSESLHDLIEKNKIISTLQKETEYQMLIQQINPHFLYNTLEIINGLIKSFPDRRTIENSDLCANSPKKL